MLFVNERRKIRPLRAGRKRFLSWKLVFPSRRCSAVWTWTRFYLPAAFAKVTASGKPFWSAVLADTSGTIEAKIWDYSGPIVERDVGKVLKVRGSVSDYRVRPSLVSMLLRLAEDNDRVDVSKLVSVAPIDREAGYDEVKALVSTIEDADYRAVCEEMLRRHEAAFRTIPAAKSVHHGFLSGLLMHTLNMLRLADFLSAQYADTVNRSLLLTGTLLHDFAKEQEFTFSELGLVTDYSTASCSVTSSWAHRRSRRLPPSSTCPRKRRRFWST